MRSKSYVNVMSDTTFTLGQGWSVRAYGFYNSPAIYSLFDWAAYFYASLSVKKTFLAKRASLTLTVADLIYQLNSLETTASKPLSYASRLRNDTRYVKLAFTFNFGKTDFKRKRVETNTNATERSRLGR
ncbi:outer membrane beta-barrel protein [Hymenobacter bucti]|uniref:Outer membrane beta-barrel protein n=1 Tax=Hymenobacter bucti TaxID=1844114 RepID=A0ABW4R240_9BACT